MSSSSHAESTRSMAAQGLSRLQLFMMSFGGIVGVGWITILGYWLSMGGPGGSVLALLIGAAASLLIADNYRLLARDDRLSSCGEIGAVSDILGPGAGFAVTAALTLACVSVVAFEAVSASWILVTLFPPLEGPPLYRISGQNVHAGSIAIAMLGTATVAALNLRPIHKTARAQNTIVWVKIAVTAVFCAAGLLHGDAQNLLPLVPPAQPGTSNVTAILSLVATMPMWFAGFHVIAILSRERSASVGPREIGWLMQISILAAFVFYASVVLAASYVVPWPTLIAAPLPAFAAFKEGLGSGVANLVLVSGLLGICSAWIACFAAGVRILVLLTRSTARAATIGIALIASVLLLAGRAALVPIVNVAALCFGLVYLAVSIAAWRRAEQLKERITTAAGAAVAAFMSAYVIVSAVNAGGWLAPETMVALAALFVARGFWIMKSKSLAHAK